MIPHLILIIEDDDDREFMASLYLKFNRLMRKEIYTIVRDSWATDDILHTTVEKLIDKIPELRTKDNARLVNYIISA